MRAARGIGAATTVCTLHPKRSNASAAARAKLIRGAIPYDTGKVVRALLKRADHLVLAGGLKGWPQGRPDGADLRYALG